MSNYVWIYNDLTMKWLRMLGFTIDKETVHTFYFGIQFYEFYIDKKRKELENV